MVRVQYKICCQLATASRLSTTSVEIQSVRIEWWSIDEYLPSDQLSGVIRTASTHRLNKLYPLRLLCVSGICFERATDRSGGILNDNLYCLRSFCIVLTGLPFYRFMVPAHCLQQMWPWKVHTLTSIMIHLNRNRLFLERCSDSAENSSVLMTQCSIAIILPSVRPSVCHTMVLWLNEAS